MLPEIVQTGIELKTAMTIETTTGRIITGIREIQETDGIVYIPTTGLEITDAASDAEKVRVKDAVMLEEHSEIEITNDRLGLLLYSSSF